MIGVVKLNFICFFFQISGTAAKLGKNAYHHCTVLVDADLKKLSALLNPNTVNDGHQNEKLTLIFKKKFISTYLIVLFYRKG